MKRLSSSQNQDLEVFAPAPAEKRIMEFYRRKMEEFGTKPAFGSLPVRTLKAVQGLLGIGDDEISISVPHRPKPIKRKPDSAFVTLDELEEISKEHPIEYVVDGLLPSGDVHIAVGDSGLGKTPWAYQLGLCVATGKPFLGREVRKGRVLYFDLENGQEGILGVSRSVCGFLGIERFPQDFFILRDTGNVPPLERATKEYKPALIVIDTLRAFRPGVESKNEECATFLQEARNVARLSDCAILLLHHVRKPGENGVPPLEDISTMEWLLEASGARALVNQTHTRIAFDRTKFGEAAFVMKQFVKLKGESGPVYLERVCDADGEPVGYQSMTGVQLLGNKDQEAAFVKLTQEFAFKDAKFVYGKSDDPTSKWLKKCEGLGLVRKVKHGCYERIG